jgi:hypothetical protein
MNAQEKNEIAQELMVLRDKFKLIESGVIEKGRNIDKYAFRPETRKLTLADAKKISHHAVARINSFLDDLKEKKL